MTFVLDASVALTWVFRDETSDIADLARVRLGTTGAVVPSLWTVEVVNGLVMGERRGRLTTADVERFIDALGRLPIQVDGPAVTADLSRLASVVRDHDLSAYDALYLDLAQP